MQPSHAKVSSPWIYRLVAGLLMAISLYYAFYLPVSVPHHLFTLMKETPNSVTVSDIQLTFKQQTNDGEILGVVAGLAGLALLLLKGRLRFSIITLLGFLLILNGLILAGPIAAYRAQTGFEELMNDRSNTRTWVDWYDSFYQCWTFAAYSFAAGAVFLLLNLLSRRSRKSKDLPAAAIPN